MTIRVQTLEAVLPRIDRRGVDRLIELLRAPFGESDASLVMRPLGQSQLVLAASPAMQVAYELPSSIDRLADVPTLSMAEESDLVHWELHGPNDETAVVSLRPRMMCSNFDMLLAAAREGLGVALLPNNICQPGLDSGELVQVLPEWRSPYGTIQAVFTSRRGLVPAVRALIEFLAEAIPCKLSLNGQSVAG
ncbi:LysR substrate-binding domain-containing protein [Halomonas sp. HK25]|uniref:LysR substrate-binding domain-containing protein n=1 Tax=Halomonas sp. HK25 TaxID=3394321 RepID=UPI0039FC84E7